MRPPATEAPEAGISFRARVEGAPDGGSLLVSRQDGGQLLVRIAGIGAPSLSQPWGSRARARLRRLAGTSEVAVTCTRVISPRRICGRVSLAGTDCGLAMVAGGLAWAVEEDLPPGDRPAYRRAALSAREAGSGLWFDRLPAPPRVWRKGVSRPRGGRP